MKRIFDFKGDPFELEYLLDKEFYILMLSGFIALFGFVVRLELTDGNILKIGESKRYEKTNRFKYPRCYHQGFVMFKKVYHYSN